MCHINSGKSYERPLAKQDLPIIKKSYQTIDPDLIDDVYDVVTDLNYPQPGVLVAIVDLLYRHQNNEVGFYGIPFMPFSAMDLNNGERLQSKEMTAFHSVFESFALAERNFVMLKNLIKDKTGGELGLLCDCGCDYIPKEQEDNKKIRILINEMNAFRSYFEAIGTKVIYTDGFDSTERTTRNIDMGSDEINAYKRMYSVLCDLPRLSVQLPIDVMSTMLILKKMNKQGEHKLSEIVQFSL